MTTPEGKIKAAIRKHLDTLAPQCWYYCPQDRFTAGIMDIVGCYHGQFFAVEVKTERNDTTELQEWTMFKVRHAGGVARTVRTLEQLQQVLSETRRQRRRP